MADTRLFKDNPTLAAGDIKVILDTTNLGNITSLPVAITGATRVLAFSLTAAEVNGGHAAVLCHDAAGAEWADVIFEFDMTDATEDDLVRSVTPANALAVDASNRVTAVSVTNDVGVTQAGADKVWATATRALTDKAGFGLANGAITAAVVATDAIDADALATDAVTEIINAIKAIVATEAAGAPGTWNELMYHIRQVSKNLLIYDKATDHMKLYKDDAVTVLYDHTMVNDASVARRGAA
jgi:hypothetical protein